MCGSVEWVFGRLLGWYNHVAVVVRCTLTVGWIVRSDDRCSDDSYYPKVHIGLV